MPTPISDLHIAHADPLPEPRLLRTELPAGEAEAAFIVASRAATRSKRMSSLTGSPKPLPTNKASSSA
ncbi:MAG: hypothetical protein ACYCZ6_16480 [Polaromonas sp.]